MNYSNELGLDLPVGSNHYRAFVGPPEKYDLISANQFTLLILFGLRENHFLLDIGCGSLRGGKLFIPYLLPGHYFGIEPKKWLIDEGIKKELGKDIIEIKQPTFSNDPNFESSLFNNNYDYILAQSIFSHASKFQIKKCMQQVKNCLNPTGIFAVSFFKGDINYSGRDWVYPKVAPYTIDKMKEFGKRVGLSCEEINWPHPGDLTWVIYYYKQNRNYIQKGMYGDINGRIHKYNASIRFYISLLREKIRVL